VFLSVLTKLAKTAFTRANLQAALNEQTGESVLWPDEARFEQAWLQKRVYETMGAGRVQYALREIERCLHQPRSERVEILSDLTIEHVLPQQWTEEWPLPSGARGVTWVERSDKTRSEDHIAETDRRDRALQTFGNLTLLTQPLNSSVSNSAFLTKKPEILKNSLLAMNRYFANLGNWDEEQIRARGRALLTTAVTRWPRPSAAPV
jgi:hypothetical protein